MSAKWEQISLRTRHISSPSKSAKLLDIRGPRFHYVFVFSDPGPRGDVKPQRLGFLLSVYVDFLFNGSLNGQLKGKTISSNFLTNIWWIDWLSLCTVLHPAQEFFIYMETYHCRWRAEKFWPMLGAQGLWAGRDLYRATPTVTLDIGFSGIIRRNRLP
jgi:hypothetical protein